MNRRLLLTSLGSLTAATSLIKFFDFFRNTNTENLMPAFFIGHGSPMNAVANNFYTKTLKEISKEIPKPSAILCISAHWLTDGSWLTYQEYPKTIHDFYGFPDDLYKINYPAKGQPDLAKSIQNLTSKLNLDRTSWGLDHGCWTVLMHLFPLADIPVIQLSIDMKMKNIIEHYELAQSISWLRKNNVLVIGSGNIVHNLNQINLSEGAQPYDWAVEFDSWVKQEIDQRNFLNLVNNIEKTSASKLSVPTLDHYLPLLYILGIAKKNENIKYFNEGFQHASISMRGVRVG